MIRKTKEDKWEIIGHFLTLHPLYHPRVDTDMLSASRKDAGALIQVSEIFNIKTYLNENICGRKLKKNKTNS